MRCLKPRPLNNRNILGIEAFCKTNVVTLSIYAISNAWYYDIHLKAIPKMEYQIRSPQVGG